MPFQDDIQHLMRTYEKLTGKTTTKGESFDSLFRKHMKQKNVDGFKRAYPTLFNKVIRPIEQERNDANERIKDLTDLLTNMEEILECGNSIKPTSIIRSAMHIAIGKTNAGSISNQ